jgi:hypothetical protein
MTKQAEAARRMLRRLMARVLPVVVLFSLGCGKPTGDISGKVTYQGKPVSGGTITFLDADKRQVGSAILGADGEYSLIKVPAGPVKITVTTPTAPTVGRRSQDSSSQDKPDPRAKTPPPEVNPNAPKWKGGVNKLRIVSVPAKYHTPEQSGLTYTVQPGSQEHNIDLQ